VPRASAGGVPARLLLIAGGLLAAAAVAGAAVWGLGRMGATGGRDAVPVVEADARPVKVRPENPGGMVVPNTDQLVLEPAQIRRAAEQRQGSAARLAPQPEAPQLDLLRREAAPKPAPVAGAEPLPPPRPAASVESPPQPVPGADAPGLAAPGTSALGTSALGTRVAALPPPQRGPAAVPGPAAGGRVQVQLGALASEAAAQAEWDRLQRRVPGLAGRQPLIQRLERGADQPPVWRLRTGGLADAADAQALCAAVRAAGGACVPLPGAAPARNG
jgi:hypothetical protein